MTSGTDKYTITGSGNIAGDNVVETELTASASGTSATVTSTTGMTANDQIGIELDDGTRQWMTITSVDSTTSVTLSTSIVGTASSGNTIFTYTTESNKPLNVSSCRFRNSSGIDIPVKMLGRDEFMLLSDKTQEGSTVTQCFFDASRSTGIFYIWPVMTDCVGRLKFSYSRQIQDFDASSNNPDFPAEWLETLTLTLAAKAAPIYRIKPRDIETILADAQRSLLDMQLNDINNGSIQVCPQDKDSY